MKYLLLCLLCLIITGFSPKPDERPLKRDLFQWNELNYSGANEYIIVAGVFRVKTNADHLLEKMKAEFADAGIYYEERTGYHYVYLEKYYHEGNAIHAIGWLKKNKEALVDIWYKTVVTANRSTS